MAALLADRSGCRRASHHSGRAPGYVLAARSPYNHRELGHINHAGSAVGRDFILTADHDYFEVLTNIHQQPNMAIAAPRFIQRDAPDIVAEICTALGW